MASVDIALILGAIRVVITFFRELKEKKGDDGKIDLVELFECIEKVLPDLWPLIEPFVREDEPASPE